MAYEERPGEKSGAGAGHYPVFLNDLCLYFFEERCMRMGVVPCACAASAMSGTMPLELDTPVLFGAFCGPVKRVEEQRKRGMRLRAMLRTDAEEHDFAWVHIDCDDSCLA